VHFAQLAIGCPSIYKLQACDILSLPTSTNDSKESLPYGSKPDLILRVEYSGCFSLPNMYVFYGSTVIIVIMQSFYMNRPLELGRSSCYPQGRPTKRSCPQDRPSRLFRSLHEAYTCNSDNLHYIIKLRTT